MKKRRLAMFRYTMCSIFENVNEQQQLHASLKRIAFDTF